MTHCSVLFVIYCSLSKYFDNMIISMSNLVYLVQLQGKNCLRVCHKLNDHQLFGIGYHLTIFRCQAATRKKVNFMPWIVSCPLDYQFPNIILLYKKENLVESLPFCNICGTVTIIWGRTVFPPRPQASLSRELSPATELLWTNIITVSNLHEESLVGAREPWNKCIKFCTWKGLGFNWPLYP